mmetsp:Transcript_23492/g.41988  ORF Transcript_23492/g.41988 Transcript_23492/m.41988 type:complete len:266 (-) Transcript_23492:272-1069(-)
MACSRSARFSSEPSGALKRLKACRILLSSSSAKPADVARLRFRISLAETSPSARTGQRGVTSALRLRADDSLTRLLRDGDAVANAAAGCRSLLKPPAPCWAMPLAKVPFGELMTMRLIGEALRGLISDISSSMEGGSITALWLRGLSTASVGKSSGTSFTSFLLRMLSRRLLTWDTGSGLVRSSSSPGRRRTCLGGPPTRHSKLAVSEETAALGTATKSSLPDGCRANVEVVEFFRDVDGMDEEFGADCLLCGSCSRPGTGISFC